MRGILLDIEGTTTSIAFVYEVLFPFARRRMAKYIRAADLTDLKREHDADVSAGNKPPAWSAQPMDYLLWLMDQDRKSTALKNIQGEIWLEGYQTGQLHGEVFSDVPAALERWRREGMDIRIFSSGSVLAQRLLFSSAAAGDLTKFLTGYFDTTTGRKDDPASYAKIAKSFGMPESDILFVSDVVRELDAARSSGMQTRLCIRSGNYPQPPHDHTIITDFQSV